MSTDLKNVTVLLPSGRRQTLKVQLDTSILQVLEDVCQKNGLPSEEYDLKHYKTILDPSSMIRFCALPNNAFLEIVPCKVPRKQAIITLSIQLDNHPERLNGNFMPTVDLETVIRKLCPEVLDESRVPVVVFMRREVAGLQKLKNTTLQSLGITCGRVLLRVTTRDSEEHPSLQFTGSVLTGGSERTQSITSGARSFQEENLSMNSCVTETSLERKEAMYSSQRKPTADISNSIKVVIRPGTNLEGINAIPLPGNNESDDDFLVYGNTNITSVDQEGSLAYPRGEEAASTCKRTLESPELKDYEKRSARSRESNNGGDISSGSTVMANQHETDKLGELNLDSVKYIDEEKMTVIFRLKEGDSSRNFDIPDSFFDITVDDVRLMMRDLKRAREEMENTPLQTGTLRQDEIKRKSEQYKEAIVRIQFPDRVVLQGMFRPTDTIAEVSDYIKKHLKDPSSEFYLYTSPPKRILRPEETLFSTDCVPCSKIYFGLSGNSMENMNGLESGYLDDQLSTAMTTQSIASLVACKMRGLRPNTGLRKEAAEDSKKETASPGTASGSSKPSSPPPKKGSTPGSGSRKESRSSDQPSSQPSKGQVPKWFKPV